MVSFWDQILPAIGNANMQAGKDVDTFLHKTLPSITNPVVQPIMSGINQAGSAIGNTQLPGLPKGTTISSSFENLNNQIGGALPGGDVLQGKATPTSLALMGSMLATGAKNPEDIANNPEDIAKTEEYPYANTPNFISKLGKGQNQSVRQIRLHPDVGGAQDEADVNNTLDRLGFQGNAQQQYAQLQPKMTELDNWIKNNSSLAKKPVTVSVDEVKSALMKEVKKQFPIGGPKGLGAQQAMNRYVNDIYDAAKPPAPLGPNTVGAPVSPSDITTPSTTIGQSVNPSKFVRMGGAKPGEAGPPGYLKEVQLPKMGGAKPAYGVEGNPTSPYSPQGQPDNVVPDKIDTPTIYGMKKAGNTATTNIFKKLNAGQPLTDLEKITLAGRNAWDSIISKYHPDVKQATTDMSRLFDATPSLESARFNAPPSAEPLNTVLPKAAQVFVPPFVSKGINSTLTNPTALKVAGGLALAGGIGAGGYLLGKNKQGTIQAPTSSAQGIQQTQNANPIQNQADNNIHTISDLPQSVDNVKPRTDGSYGIADIYSMQGLDGTSLAISPEAAEAERNNISNTEKAHAQEYLANPALKDQEVTQPLQQIQNKEDFTKQIQPSYEQAKTLVGKFEDARNQLKTVDPSLLSINTTWDDLSKKLSGKYATLSQTMNDIKAMYPGVGSTLITGQPGNTLSDLLEHGEKSTLYNFYSTLNVGTGDTGTKAQAQAQIPPSTGISSPPPNALSGFNTPATLTGSGINAPLPSIGQ